MGKLTPALARQMDVPRMPKNLLLELIFLARGRTSVVVSHDDLAKRLQVSRKTVARAMICLRESGLVRTERTHRSKDGYRSADRIELVENSWTVSPVGAARLGDNMSPRGRRSKGSECPLGLRDKMSQPLKEFDRASATGAEKSSREGDDHRLEAHTDDPAEPRPQLRLLSGGKAA